jgi:hypothetical protein
MLRLRCILQKGDTLNPSLMMGTLVVVLGERVPAKTKCWVASRVGGMGAHVYCDRQVLSPDMPVEAGQSKLHAPWYAAATATPTTMRITSIPTPSTYVAPLGAFVHAEHTPPLVAPSVCMQRRVPARY